MRGSILMRGRCWTIRWPARSSGGAATVRDGLDAFVRRTGADELMVTANIFDHDKRKRSFEIVAEVAIGTE